MSKAAARESAEEKPKSCFVMMPISDVVGYPLGHFKDVYEQVIRPAVEAAGYKSELATSTNSAHMIQLDIIQKVATADLCICDLSTNNPNVLFEYGIRQAFDKPTVLIKDDRTDRLFDISGFRCVDYKHSLRITEAKEAIVQITSAIVDTVNAVGTDQIFSLVKLMQLSKASMPGTEISKEDARYELLSGQMKLILQQLESRQKHERVAAALIAGPLSGVNTITAADISFPTLTASGGLTVGNDPIVATLPSTFSSLNVTTKVDDSITPSALLSEFSLAPKK